MGETIEQLRERYLRMDAEYRAMGERIRKLTGTPGPQAKKELDELLRELHDHQERLDRLQKDLRDRLDRQPGR